MTVNIDAGNIYINLYNKKRNRTLTGLYFNEVNLIVRYFTNTPRYTYCT